MAVSLQPVSLLHEARRPTLQHLEYRTDVDGRAIAVLAVIVFHAALRLLPVGFIGVDVFFVISGFLISGIILRALGRGSFSLLEFYGRRVKRIFQQIAHGTGANVIDPMDFVCDRQACPPVTPGGEPISTEYNSRCKS